MYNGLKVSLRSKKGEYGDQDERSEVSESQPGSSFQHTQTSLSSFATHGRLTLADDRPRSLSPASGSGRSSVRSRSVDRSNEPLGLHVVYDPPADRAVDIVFVHGLGGTSRLSWSWHRDLSLFWPQEWLPLEPGLEDARILTFGYNANFLSPARDLFNISDFAKDLLVQLKFGSDESAQSLNMGQVPIVFVVHSMGGLVVKKAYILGSQDAQFQQILNSVRAIIFLATPHRGSNLAQTLNKFLQVSFQAPKQYVSDLQRSSASIADINDQFKLHADKMQIVSFFEMQPTPVGLRKTIVVERESAILDYPNEISTPLNADHHTICKYPSRVDPNYLSVRNVVKSVVDKFKLKDLRRRKSIDKVSLMSVPSTDELMSRLGVSERPFSTFEALIEQYVPGSSDWILSDQHFRLFLEDKSTQPSILHIHGNPGSGKSILASFLIQYLEHQGLSTQFWYFRFDDQFKRSIRQCLLSIAFQIMQSFPEYSRRMMAIASSLETVARSDIRSLWQKLFVNILDKLGGYDPIYWVIDAVDESESAQTFLGIFGSLKALKFPLRIIILTRPQTTTKYFDRLKATLPANMISQMSMATPDESLRLFIANELQFTPWEDDLKETITTTLLVRSQGNFLWLSLIIKDLINCDTVEELEQALEEVPSEIIGIYERIEKSVIKDLKKSDAPLVQAILFWIVCSERQLTEDELKEALRPRFSVLNLQHTISRLCSDFVAVDKRGNISLVHYTAREFLTKSSASILAVRPDRAHTFILDKCLSVLTDSRFRLKLRSQGCVGFLRYCCLSWSHHMARSDIDGHSNSNIRAIASFFKNIACLAWAEAVATTGYLQVFTQTAKALNSFLETARQLNQDENPLTIPILDLELLGNWSTELVRIVGKFGTHLLQCPSCIHTLVPLFCPPESAIGRQFPATSAKITGISKTGWDDSLAKFSVGSGQRPKAILALDNQFGIVSSDKSVHLYNASTFQEIRKFHHDELLVAAQFNYDGSMLATCGPKSIKVWETLTGRFVHAYSNPMNMKAMAVSFSRDSSEIIVCCVDSKLGRQFLADPESWVQVHWQSWDQTAASLGRGGTPNCVSFSPDGTKIAIAYRTAPVSVWDTETGNLIGRSESKHARKNLRHENKDYPARLTWNSVTEHVLGITMSGKLFKWYPLDPDQEDIPVDSSYFASEIACSADGRLIVTAQRDGSLKIFNFENLSLLYDLTCMTRVTSLAMSPDGRRIYDLRQSACNVWEPNALIRMAEQDEKSSDAASSHYDNSVTFSLASEASAVILDPVTALAVSSDPKSSAYAFGNDGSTVKFIPSLNRDEPLEFTCGILGITSVSVSGDGSCVAAASLDRQVAVRRVTADGQLEHQTALSIKSTSPVLQLLLDMDGGYLVIRYPDSVDTWSVSNKCLVSSAVAALLPWTWLRHPVRSDTLLSITKSSLQSHNISDLSNAKQWTIETPTAEGDDDIEGSSIFRRPSTLLPLESRGMETPDGVWVSPNHANLLLQLSKATETQDTHELRFIILDISALLTADSEPGAGDAKILARSLPKPILDLMERPLGFTHEGVEIKRSSSAALPTLRMIHKPTKSQGQGEQQNCALAFLDRDFWVRTWSLDDVEGTASRRHFFLPRDWINLDCLHLAQVTTDGRFLCPRNGEVAVVHNGLSSVFLADQG